VNDSGEHLVSWDVVLANPRPMRRHVVVLGAGASLAAFPNGAPSGRRMPLMQDLVATVGLASVFTRHQRECPPGNFETVYSDLCNDDEHAELRHDLEEAIYSFFDQLDLPPTPTLYDELLLSLRPKDLIATFNWDPFLYDAWERNASEVPLPRIAHLHGNVRIGYCLEDRIQGRNGTDCAKCGKPFTRSKLLFPIRTKNYASDPLIRSEWEVLKEGLREAFTLTFLGYGAPSTDVEAVALLHDAWKLPSDRSFETIEIIDIRPKIELLQQWQSFFVTQHCQVFDTFRASWIPRHPRRTCEALIIPTGEGKYVGES